MVARDRVCTALPVPSVPLTASFTPPMPPAKSLRKSPSTLSLPPLAHRPSHHHHSHSRAHTTKRSCLDDSITDGHHAHVKPSDGFRKRAPLEGDRVSHPEASLPSRPASRLGHHHHAPPPKHAPVRDTKKEMGQVPQRTGLRSLAAHWTRNVAKRIIAQADATTPTMFAEKEDNDIESMDIIDIEGEPPSPSQQVANDDDDVEMAFEDTSLSESSESEYSDSSSDEHIAQSRESTPEPDADGDAHEDQHDLTPPPYQVPDSRPRFCCLPSPLSFPENTASDSPSASAAPGCSQTATNGDPPRHMYPNHGYSRPSLLFTRSFWTSKRERDYACVLTEKAPEGAQEIETGAEPRVEAEPNYPTWTHCMPPICVTMYPRTGDVAALKHSWGMQVDMCFWTTPMYTIHKLLWMFAVHAGVAAREEVNAMLMGEETNGGTIEDDEFEQVTMESESTEASDRTLVDDASVDCGWTKSEQDVIMEDAEGRGADESLPLPSPPAPPRALPPDSNRRTISPYQPKWALTEYARWQLLVDMVQHEQVGLLIPPPPMQTQMASAAPARRPPRFFLEDEDEEGWVDEGGRRVSREDEEDEDYGELVVNPIFGGQQGFAV